MTGKPLDLGAFTTMSRVELAAYIARQNDLPQMLRLALSAAFATVLKDADYARYRGLLLRALAALSETDSGRALLAELGVAWHGETADD